MFVTIATVALINDKSSFTFFPIPLTPLRIFQTTSSFKMLHGNNNICELYRNCFVQLN